MGMFYILQVLQMNSQRMMFKLRSENEWGPRGNKGKAHEIEQNLVCSMPEFGYNSLWGTFG